MSKYITAIVFFACMTMATDAFAKADYTLAGMGEKKSYKLEVDAEDGAAEPVVHRDENNVPKNTDAIRRCVGKATAGKAKFDVHVASDGTALEVHELNPRERGGAAGAGRRERSHRETGDRHASPQG